jgi:hypothetical protein
MVEGHDARIAMERCGVMGTLHARHPQGLAARPSFARSL